MKKREFLTQGGVLASGMLASPWVSASAPASSTAHTPSPPASPSEAQAPQGLGAWQARLGERYKTLSTLGRDVTLQLAEVLPLEGADSGVEQFRLSFMAWRPLSGRCLCRCARTARQIACEFRGWIQPHRRCSGPQIGGCGIKHSRGRYRCDGRYRDDTDPDDRAAGGRGRASCPCWEMGRLASGSDAGVACVG